MQTLFVTALLELPSQKEEHKTDDMRMQNFIKLAKTGITIVAFISEKYRIMIQGLCVLYPNIRIHRVLNIQDTVSYKIFEPYRDKLPPYRNILKDTFEFLSLMSAKAEFLHEVIEYYGDTYTQYAWADYNIWYIFKNDIYATQRFQLYSTCTLNTDLVCVPGCWSKGAHSDQLWHRINWRFCGGFLIGKKAAIQEFTTLYLRVLDEIIQEMGSLTWEVNIWSHLENKYGWSSQWFSGDHNESILKIPMDHIQLPDMGILVHDNWPYMRLCDGNANGRYTYPVFPAFEPTSSSFIEYNGQKLLNIRCVNYKLTPVGGYIIHHEKGYLYTKNILAKLDASYNIIAMDHITDKPEGLVSKSETIQGIEDIRLFEHGGELMFIATQREFSAEPVNRMMIGNYSVEHLALEDCMVLEPPTPTGCEKNWIPIVRGGALQFIYKWHPFQIVELTDPSSNKVSIVEEHKMPTYFERMRGSTPFIECSGELVGIIHYSEEAAPRRYFHALVWLDKETYRPKYVSQPFVFDRIGIEFCVGFTLDEENYARFWFSQHDRDPMWVRVHMSKFQRFQIF
jgi:hypothetical protein